MSQILLKESGVNKTFVIQRPKHEGPGPTMTHQQPKISQNQPQQPMGSSHAQVTAYESSPAHYQPKQPTRLTTNGSSYEIKGIPPSQGNFSNGGQRHIFEVVNRKSIIQVTLSKIYFSDFLFSLSLFFILGNLAK